MIFLFVGEEADGGETRRHATQLGLQDRVRFLGRQPASTFADLMLITDIGVNLRRPPTNGETSGALLNLLAAGVPSIITDVATFSDYPAHAVRKVRWETEGQDGLNTAMKDLATNRSTREALGARRGTTWTSTTNGPASRSSTLTRSNAVTNRATGGLPVAWTAPTRCRSGDWKLRNRVTITDASRESPSSVAHESQGP